MSNEPEAPFSNPEEFFTEVQGELKKVTWPTVSARLIAGTVSVVVVVSDSSRLHSDWSIGVWLYGPSAGSWETPLGACVGDRLLQRGDSRMAAHWYVIHTYSGQEARAKAALLETRQDRDGREDAIEEIFIPEENVVEVVKGQRRTSKRKFLPGYMLVQMDLDDEIWHIVKNTAKITGFVGAGNSSRLPIPEQDVERMMGQAKTTPSPSPRSSSSRARTCAWSRTVQRTSRARW